jgi:hypothetical protein
VYVTPNVRAKVAPTVWHAGTVAQNWGEAPAPQAQCATPLGLSLSEGLGVAVCCEHECQPTRKEIGIGIRGALLKMGEGPPKSACRSGLQTTASCWGKEPWW